MKGTSNYTSSARLRAWDVNHLKIKGTSNRGEEILMNATDVNHLKMKGTSNCFAHYRT